MLEEAQVVIEDARGKEAPPISPVPASADPESLVPCFAKRLREGRRLTPGHPAEGLLWNPRSHLSGWQDPGQAVPTQLSCGSAGSSLGAARVVKRRRRPAFAHGSLPALLSPELQRAGASVSPPRSCLSHYLASSFQDSECQELRGVPGPDFSTTRLRLLRCSQPLAAALGRFSQGLSRAP